MKSIAPAGLLLAAFGLAGCERPKEAGSMHEPAKTVNTSLGTDATAKLVLGPPSPVGPIIPAPEPRLPANVQEGIERKDPEAGPDMKKEDPGTTPTQARTPAESSAKAPTDSLPSQAGPK